MRILFVDDEPNILQGLRRMLHPMRREWQMEFAGSGAEALEVLARGPFDAVVSDMRMPGMDGAELLAEVKRRHPHVVRVVLSGQSDQAAILRSLDSTHQYMSKPCDAETLKSTLVRACAVRRLLADEQLQRLVSQLGALPSPPTIYRELVAECQAADPSLKRVADVIGRDLGMAAQVLHLVNSAFFGRRRRISDPFQAVQLLGLNTVKALVLSAHVFTAYQGTPARALSLETLQRSSLATNACARMIVGIEHCDGPTGEDASVAALLHDVGMLVLATKMPSKWDEAVERTRTEGSDLCEAEREALGGTHADVGAYLLGLWALPDPVVEAVAYHHAPKSSVDLGSLTPLTIVHAADVIVHDGEGGDGAPHARLDVAYFEELGLTDRVPIWREQWARTVEAGGDD